jgi:hypothetical protein
MTLLARGLAVMGPSMESNYPLSLYEAFIKDVCDIRCLKVPLDLLAAEAEQVTREDTVTGQTSPTNLGKTTGMIVRCCWKDAA